jgi:hypothetical protein
MTGVSYMTKLSAAFVLLAALAIAGCGGETTTSVPEDYSNTDTSDFGMPTGSDDSGGAQAPPPPPL